MTAFAVKTEEKAIEILKCWIAKNTNESNLSADTHIQPYSARCACGETGGMKAHFEGDETTGIAIVAICKACGDDDNFTDEVIATI